MKNRSIFVNFCASFFFSKLASVLNEGKRLCLKVSVSLALKFTLSAPGIAMEGIDFDHFGLKWVKFVRSGLKMGKVFT